MNYKMVGRIIGLVLAIETIFLIPPMILCFCDGDTGAGLAFVYTIGIGGLAAGALTLLCRSAKKGFYAREGLICVGLSWIAMSLLGCLPFCISGSIPKFVDALFEIASGFSTTGASILPEVESLPRGILFWRSFSHWLGGMGVLVFLLAVVPISGRNDGFTMHLLRAESPGPNVGKLVPRMRRTATILYLLYIALTVLDFVFLRIGGMSTFESICTAVGTAGTGGFGVKNDSIASYSPYLQNVCTVFMLLFGVNFSCYYLLLLKRVKDVLRDEELRIYILGILGCVTALAINVRGYYGSLRETLRYCFFTVASLITTSGFATTDFDLWPTFSKTILVGLMLMGACAGSTGGGMKISRVLLLCKSAARNIRSVIHPTRVQTVRVNGQRVSETVLSNTNAYLSIYVIILIASTLLVSLDGFSFTTNLTAVISCVNNIGPGLEAVGPTCNFSGFSALSKLVLIFDMLAGRLEIFPILILFTTSAWKRQ